MFELVHILGDTEISYATREKELDAELLKQMHVRSIAAGVVEIRKVSKKDSKKK